MSWLQKLYETYEHCVGREPNGSEPLIPVSHTVQQAHIEIVIDGGGNFRRARVIERQGIILPATEESANRTSRGDPHALADKIQYCAGDYPRFGGKKATYFAKYLGQLERWCASEFSHPKAKAVRDYVRKETVVADLASASVLCVRSGDLLTDWPEREGEPQIFKQLTAKRVNGAKVRDQGDALIRWVVEVSGDPQAETWSDVSLQDSWCGYYASLDSDRGPCIVSGNSDRPLAKQHPAKLRHGADKAKLISSNDTTGYTFRGRFVDAAEALGVAFEVTQKAHNALRWLIARQAYRNGDQVILTWSIGGKQLPDPFASSHELFGGAGDPLPAPIGMDTAQAFAIRLNKAIAGYGGKLDDSDGVVVMALDSATPGRMAITFYRELRGSEFLERIRAWHTQCSWPQNFGKDRTFVGAAAPRDIAEAAYGRRLDDVLRKATVERLLPCIIDGAPLPPDLVESARHRASHRASLAPWEWEKCLGIACSLLRAHHIERNYKMSLELDRRTRDYLYGRLLAVAEYLEGRALYVAGEKRDTTSARLMQRFADRPYSTWRVIELSLTPYKARLRAQRPGFLFSMEKLIDELIAAFEPADFCRDAALSGEFLLAYHCQREALRPSSAGVRDDDLDTNGQELSERPTP